MGNVCIYFFQMQWSRMDKRWEFDESESFSMYFEKKPNSDSKISDSEANLKISLVQMPISTDMFISIGTQQAVKLAPNPTVRQ